MQFRNFKVIYRRYAGLFFTFCVDVNDNELAYLEAIHLFVELLDQFFGNVCELDLVFNFHKVTIPLFAPYLAGSYARRHRTPAVFLGLERCLASSCGAALVFRLARMLVFRIVLDADGSRGRQSRFC